jgi:excisionase family DNA binding protein
MEMKQSFSTSEVATYCHVTADTIRKWAEAGRISVFKTPGGHRRIRRDDLVAFMRENGIPVHEDLKNDGIKALIVEDDRTVIAVINRFLDHTKTNFEVSVAEDGFEAGHMFASFQPTLVFLDIRLPGLDGFEVCRRIKATTESANTHIIAMTAYYDEEVDKKIRELGASLCLAKPFTPDDLRRALSQVGIEVS